MFFSAKELAAYSYGADYSINSARAAAGLARKYDARHGAAPLTLREARIIMRKAKATVVARQGYGDEVNFLYKWLRPWDVVPALANWRAPEGEYGIGVEVEMGFVSREAASTIADKIKNWKYIAIDYEGGQNPIEATFPPVVLSKFSRSQAVRYLKLLKENEHLVAPHDRNLMVGTHINVSSGSTPQFDSNRVTDMRGVLWGLANSYDIRTRTAVTFCDTYFGRRPYGSCYNQGGYIEYKLFNSTTDVKVLKKYVAVAVALTKMIEGDMPITRNSVMGYVRANVSI